MVEHNATFWANLITAPMAKEEAADRKQMLFD